MHSAFDRGPQAVQEATSRFVSSLLVGLASYYPVGQYDPGGTLRNAGGAAVAQAYVDKCGHGGAPLRWHLPCAEEVSLANELLESCLAAPARELLELCASGELQAAAVEPAQRGPGAGPGRHAAVLNAALRSQLAYHVTSYHIAHSRGLPAERTPAALRDKKPSASLTSGCAPCRAGRRRQGAPAQPAAAHGGRTDGGALLPARPARLPAGCAAGAPDARAPRAAGPSRAAALLSCGAADASW